MKTNPFGPSFILSALICGVPTLALAADTRYSDAFGSLTYETIDSAVVSPEPAIEIQAFSDSGRIGLKTGHIYSSQNADHGQFAVLSVKATSPINKGSTSTDLATLDGFANASTISIFITRHSTPLRNPYNDPDYKEFSQRVCDRVKAGYKLHEDSVDSKQKIEDLECTEISNVERYAPDLFPRFEKFFWDDKVLFQSWGIGVKFGSQKFEFVDESSAQINASSESPWSIKAHYSWLPTRLKTLITIGAEYQRAYKEGKLGALCPPIDSETGVASCAAGALGEPERQTKRLLSIEGRRLIGAVGASLKITHDLASDVTGVDLPMHFVRSKDQKLSAGLRIGWRSDTNDAAFGVFVGSAFNLF